MPQSEVQLLIYTLWISVGYLLAGKKRKREVASV